MTDPAVQLKVAYLGGGSRNWARVLMRDLACCPELGGELRLFDIDFAAAKVNEELGNWLQEQPGVVSRWHYRAVEKSRRPWQGLISCLFPSNPVHWTIWSTKLVSPKSMGCFSRLAIPPGHPG